ncbi:hypothetical protein AOLI_G00188590 [Acnodon oligacanthus]
MTTTATRGTKLVEFGTRVRDSWGWMHGTEGFVSRYSARKLIVLRLYQTVPHCPVEKHLNWTPARWKRGGGSNVTSRD